MFYQILLSRRVKRFPIITYEYGGMYELPHELLNALRIRIFGNKKKGWESV